MTEGLARTGTGVVSYPSLAALAGAIEAGAPVPGAVLACAGTAAADSAGSGEAAAARQALGLVREWPGLPALAESRLVIVTAGAVAAGPGDGVTDLAGAACWGLVRSAAREHPGQFILADLPGAGADGDRRLTPAAAGALTGALGSGEPELAVRGQDAYARRLARPGLPPAGQAATGLRDQVTPPLAGMVLITEGTSGLGALVARHLGAGGRAAHVLLSARSGPAAGAARLAADLAAAGVTVRVAQCDAADRDAVAGLLAAVPVSTPLTAVVHAAGVPDDGTWHDNAGGPLTAAELGTALRLTADTAWNLHELTREAGLREFLLFSSSAGTLGVGGQGGQAAASAFLDALASYRRAAGLPALSLAWGSRADAGNGTGQQHGGDEAAPLTAQDVLGLLDLAMTRDEAVLIPARLDLAALRARAARGEEVPALWHGLVGVPAQPVDSAAAAALRQQLAGLAPADRDRVLVDLIRSHVAAVLMHVSAGAVEPDRTFTELGFDSMIAVELRNRLSAATGLRLPATIAFDYPTPTVLAGYLRDRVTPEIGGGADEDTLRTFLATVPLSRLRDAGLMEALAQMAGIRADSSAPETAEKIDSIDALDAESLVRLAMDGEEG
jgi:acyl carrier protein